MPTQLSDFRAFCQDRTERDLTGPTGLHEWSVTSWRDFWRAFLEWSGLLAEGDAEVVCAGDDVRTARFFPGLRLNYVENLLRPLGDDDAPALTSVHGDGSVERLTRSELRREVLRTSAALLAGRSGEGGPAVVVASNSATAVVAALALTAVGVTVSTGAPDMGASTLLGRFTQVRPRLLLVDRRQLGREGTGPDAVLAELVTGLPTVRQVLLLDDLPLPDLSGVEVDRLADRVDAVPAHAAVPDWPRLPFEHPLWVMFSSGTTGPPKAMVHGAGGTLLEHLKEHRLHGDLGPADTLYFHTTTAWMMWNWQLSALAVGAHVVLYDGPVRGPETLWELAAAHRVTVLGTSPAYLQLCQDEGYRPRDAVDLRSLRAVLSTGAVLHDWQFDWVAESVGPVPLQSISGGTDILGCFVLGHPEQPVRRGRCQSLGLGLDVAALGEDGRPVLGEVGDLVCRLPFPSRPLHFLDDPDGERFRAAYFSQHPPFWTHGDRIDIDADGSSRMHGRADGVLNVNGIRIGPSEIYTIVRRVPGVADAVAVEQRDPVQAGGTRLVLLVVLQPGTDLDDALARRIRATLRREGSAAHVPSLVLAVPEVPMTHNGKRSESAARAVLDGDPVRNTSALRNPAALGAIAEAARRAGAAAPAPSTAAPGASGAPGAPEDTAVTVGRVFAEVLGAPVGETTDFFDAGGTSRQTMTLLRRLRLALDRPLLMEDFLADPTVRGVAVAMASGSGGRPGLEVLRRGRDDVPPLCVVHGYQGDVDIYRALVDALDTAGPVYGLTTDPFAVERPGASVTAIAAEHVQTVMAEFPRGPVSLVGFSFGGLVAFEVARQLTERGRSVGLLGLLDTEPPAASVSPLSRRLRRLAYYASLVVPGVGDEDLPAAVRRRLRRADGGGREHPGTPGTLDELGGADRDLLPTAERVHNAHRWGGYAGPVTYFRARRRIPLIMNQLYEWRRVAPRLTVVPVPGAHRDLLAAEHADVLAARVSEALGRAPRRTS